MATEHISLLVAMYKYSPHNIKILVDDGREGSVAPTKENMVRAHLLKFEAV